MKKLLIIFFLIILGALAGFLLFFLNNSANTQEKAFAPTSNLFQEKEFTTYIAPKLPKKERYDIYLIGDSMMHALGPRGGRFTQLLSQSYPELFFEVSNYAEANQNIEMLPERLNQEVQADHDLILPPILSGSPDIIIIESYGYNPLSHLGTIDAGLARHREKIQEAMTILTNKFPDTVIFFAATIAPDRMTYGAKVLQSPPESLAAQADERIAYIKMHMEYALERNIPLIDIYTRSLDSQGDGDIAYINPTDNIHPSFEGVELIAQTMVDSIVVENIFPQ